MSLRCTCLFLLVFSFDVPTFAGTPHESGRKVLAEWHFGGKEKFAGWQPNALVTGVDFNPDCVRFETTGHDPIITSPQFDLASPSNSQWVEIEIDAGGPGKGEFFYTHKTTGRYGGFEPHLRCTISVPAAGRQIVRIWPFWQGLKRIIRIRWDPPAGITCRLYAIRIVSSGTSGPVPRWEFSRGPESWQTMHGAEIRHAEGRMAVKALQPQALIITPVKPFKAERRSMLKLAAACKGEDFIGLFWVTKERAGLTGIPVCLQEHGSGTPLDLRAFPAWSGTVTHLALGFGTFGTETLIVEQLSLSENDPAQPFLKPTDFGFKHAVNRIGKPAIVRITLRHAGGPRLPRCKAELYLSPEPLKLPDPEKIPDATFPIPELKKGETCTFTTQIPATNEPVLYAALKVNSRTFRTTLHFDKAVDQKYLETDGYSVPPPHPVRSKYQIGIYYFPGWSPDQMSRWEKQADFPERDPVLGWYEEGNPEVADWHIKWAVENCIDFFIFDWYWRDGEEVLGKGLNDGFLKARYNEQMQFAVMWANHKPFADHTPEQLFTVLDYWIKHYFRKKNYLLRDGKPYVSFFQPQELINCLGSEAKVKQTFDAMRTRAREAGFAGLHFGACQGIEKPYLETLKAAGFDSVTGYNYIDTGAVADQCSYRQFMHGHNAIWKRIETAGVLPYIPLLTVGWDSRPWHGPYARRKFARRTEYFEEGLARLKAHLDATGKTTAILEAWNEWGEGSYIEPNRKFGFRDLEAIRKTFGGEGSFPVNITPRDAGLDEPYDLRGRK